MKMCWNALMSYSRLSVVCVCVCLNKGPEETWEETRYAFSIDVTRQIKLNCRANEEHGWVVWRVVKWIQTGLAHWADGCWWSHSFLISELIQDMGIWESHAFRRDSQTFMSSHADLNSCSCIWNALYWVPAQLRFFPLLQDCGKDYIGQYLESFHPVPGVQ